MNRQRDSSEWTIFITIKFGYNFINNNYEFYPLVRNNFYDIDVSIERYSSE